MATIERRSWVDRVAEIISLVDIKPIIHSQKQWIGTARELKDRLEINSLGTPNHDYFEKKQAHQISGELRRIAPSLRNMDESIEVIFNRNRNEKQSSSLQTR